MAISTSKQEETNSFKGFLKIRGYADATQVFNSLAEYVFYTSINKKLPKKTQKRIVEYGTWFAALALLFILPELLILAKESRLVGISGFFTAMLFNQASWVLMLVVLANCVLLVQSLGDVSSKKRKGWDKIYLAFLINFSYIIIQIGHNTAASLLSLCIVSIGLFILFDIKKCYKPSKR